MPQPKRLGSMSNCFRNTLTVRVSPQHLTSRCHPLTRTPATLIDQKSGSSHKKTPAHQLSLRAPSAIGDICLVALASALRRHAKNVPAPGESCAIDDLQRLYMQDVGMAARWRTAHASGDHALLEADGRLYERKLYSAFNTNSAQQFSVKRSSLGCAQGWQGLTTSTRRKGHYAGLANPAAAPP